MKSPSTARDTFLTLESTNEVRLRLRAGTVEDLFHLSLEGMASVVYGPYRASHPQLTVPIRVSSIDVNALMVDFLSETLWQGEVHQAVFPEMRVKRFTNSEIEADLMGIPINRLDKNIHTVAYTGMRVCRNNDGLWQTEVSLQV